MLIFLLAPFSQPAGAATVKRECDGVGASERSAARLSHTPSHSRFTVAAPGGLGIAGQAIT